MRISVKIKPGSKVASVEEIAEREFLIRVKSPPKEGKANIELIKTLSRHFGVPKSRVIIARGAGSRNKIIDIL
ncbi:MAG: DUF167 domain-containing protein [Candidatus Omnitrophica bacterium]|nr:DUF167 domain-containing protein [Candidatus Omnitrophota bacterium]